MRWGYRAGWLGARFVLRWILGVQWIDPERVPLAGAVIVAPNHRSYLDPPLVGCGIDRELHFFAKRELFRMPVVGALVRHFNSIPIRRGTADREGLRLSLAALSAGGGLVLFPEGTRAPAGRFLEPKTGIGMIAERTGAAIVPVYVSGTGGGFRSLLRSATRKAPIRVLYGDPIDVDLIRKAGDDPRRYELMAHEVMRHIRRLKSRLDGPSTER